MNYSIILLGATISVSLFIRICGVCSALEINSHSARGSDSSESWSLPNYKDEIFLGNLQHNNDPYKSETTMNNIEDTQKDSSKHLDQTNPNCVDDSQHDICGEKPLCNTRQHQSRLDPHLVSMSEIPPDGCKLTYNLDNKILLLCESISTIPSLNFSLEQLEIVKSSFDELPANAFEDVAITSIILRHNIFSRISPYAFADIENVTHLHILNNEKLSYLPYDLYKGLNTLVYLNLAGNNINFEVYERCKERNVEDIPLVLKSLQYMSFAGNPLNKIPSQMWAGLRESPVTALILSSCSLKEISPESFSYLKNLKTLYLDGNPDLDFKTAFLGLQNHSLKTLKLSDNRFTSIPKDLLSEVVAQNLEVLELAGNFFSRIYSEDFPAMPKLITLDLANCGIKEISEGVFEKLPNLKELDLNGNSLFSIPTSVFSLSGLRYLSLDNNAPAREVVGNGRPNFEVNETISALRYLVTLSINNTPLRKITKGMFDGIPMLLNLFLENAEITTIEDGAFYNSSSLRNLYLSNNQLTEIRATMFDGLDNLTFLYLENNMISFVYPDQPFLTEEEDDESIIKCQQGLEVSSDPNRLSPFKSLNSLEYLELAGNRLQCLYPELFEGLDQLTTLDLNRNKIRTWESPVFPKNFSLTRGDASGRNSPVLKLYLSGNQIRSISDAILEDLVSYSPNELDITGNNMVCNLGSCGLRDLMASNFDFPVPTVINWTDSDSYTCVHRVTGYEYFIKSISNKTCIESDAAAIYNSDPDTISPIKKTVIMVVGIVCGTCFIAGLLVTGYKKRLHLSYVFFKVKLNVREISPRKAKISEVHEPNFDYDLFVSYHNQDRSFIIDQFLPEVEDPEITKNESSDYEVYKVPGVQAGFRVCLHERHFEAGVPITENIVECVDKSKKIVIILTKKYLESQWCLFEMNLAYHRLLEARRNSFVLVLMEHIPNDMRTKVLSYLMRSRTYLEWPGEAASPTQKQRFWNQLRASLVD